MQPEDKTDDRKKDTQAQFYIKFEWVLLSIGNLFLEFFEVIFELNRLSYKLQLLFFCFIALLALFPEAHDFTFFFLLFGFHFFTFLKKILKFDFDLVF